ncbi:hypothetical protein PCH70_35480 [Pseudomonas cichorii JBC1]|nr:hypothetical protein PCH70_35480 [Pseudomonas cichorii JBC1]
MALRAYAADDVAPIEQSSFDRPTLHKLRFGAHVALNLSVADQSYTANDDE